MQITQQLPFGFQNDIILDLSDITDFDDMILDPKGFVVNETKRTQLNVSNQNRSYTRHTRVPLLKGPVASWGVFEFLINDLLNYYHEQVGAVQRSNIAEIFCDCSYAQLVIDKRTRMIDWTTMFTVTSAQAPMKAVQVKFDKEMGKIEPNSKSKPWVDEPWQKVDNGAYIPPPLKSMAFTAQTERTERYCDTFLFNISYEPNRAGYHVINQDKSFIMAYGPTTEYRKIGIRFCHIDEEFDDAIKGAFRLKKFLEELVLPGKSKHFNIDIKSQKLLREQFSDCFTPDPLNKELYGKHQLHTCLHSQDLSLSEQLWNSDFKTRIHMATKGLKKATSPSIFKLFISNLKKFNEVTDELELIRPLTLYNQKCNKCKVQSLYSNFIDTLVLLDKHINVNSIKELFGETHLSDIYHEMIPSGQASLNFDPALLPKGSNPKKSIPLQQPSYKLHPLGLQDSISKMLNMSLFEGFSEARKLSILNSIFNPSSTDIRLSDLDYSISDTIHMLEKVSSHQHKERGLKELKSRDIRTLRSLHDELSYVIEILDTIPKKVKNHQYDFLKNQEHVPDTSLVIKVPTSNVDVKAWGTRQRHCIGSYAENVVAEQRSVIGVWDTDQDTWLGHMSFAPILIALTKPNPSGKFEIKYLNRRKLEVQQFYGAGNKSIDPGKHKAVVNYMAKLVDDWLFDNIQWSDADEEFIEENYDLSLTRSERRMYHYAKLADGEKELKLRPGYSKRVSFSDFALLVEETKMYRNRKKKTKIIENEYVQARPRNYHISIAPVANDYNVLRDNYNGLWDPVGR